MQFRDALRAIPCWVVAGAHCRPPLPPSLTTGEFGGGWGSSGALWLWLHYMGVSLPHQWQRCEDCEVQYMAEGMTLTISSPNDSMRRLTVQSC